MQHEQDQDIFNVAKEYLHKLSSEDHSIIGMTLHFNTKSLGDYEVSIRLDDYTP